MKKSNVKKLEIMAQDFLQYRYRQFLMSKHDVDWWYYQGATAMIEAFGGNWRRSYRGKDTEEEKNDYNNYSHTVWFPDDNTCDRLNEDAWKDD